MSKRKRSSSDNAGCTSTHNTRPRGPRLGTDSRPNVDPHSIANATRYDSLSLCELLDFSEVTEQSELTNRFQLIASTLLLEHVLVLTSENGTFEYEILELEFYLYKSGCHEDPFTHASEEQRESGNWYVFLPDPTRSTIVEDSTRCLLTSIHQVLPPCTY